MIKITETLSVLKTEKSSLCAIFSSGIFKVRCHFPAGGEMGQRKRSRETISFFYRQAFFYKDGNES